MLGMGYYKTGLPQSGPQNGGWQAGGCTFSGSSDFLGETRNDTAGGIVLVQGVGQLLAGGLQLLAQGEAVEHDRILGEGDTTVRGWGGVGSTQQRSQPACLSYIAFIMLRYVPFILAFWRVYDKWMLNFVKGLLCIY